MPEPAVHRVALYFAPDPASAWGRAGSAWLGRCASGRPVGDAPKVAALDDATWRALRADPRRYGWHATLKPPFRPAPGVGLPQVLAAVDALCARHRRFELPALQVGCTGGFLALRPAHAERALDRLAADAVQALHPLAAPLDAAELARRRRAPLTPEQDALLQAWGYPWVLSQFRFHLSLTGPLGVLPADALQGLMEAAAQHFHELPPCPFDRVSVFIEPAPGADLILHSQHGLTA